MLKIFRSAVYYYRGDADLAKKLALADMSKLYGVSEVSGSDTIMKFPPEKYYPSIAGSHDYIREVALADARTVDKDAMNVMLVPTKETADDIRTKQPPRYALYYQDKAGVWNEVAGQRFGWVKVSFVKDEGFHLIDKVGRGRERKV